MYRRGRRLLDGTMWVQDHDGVWVSLMEAAERYNRESNNTYLKTRD